MRRGKERVTDWLRHCPTWQFVLTWAVGMAMGCAGGGLIGQLWRHRFDWSEILGLAAGGAIAASIMATWQRQTQQRS